VCNLYVLDFDHPVDFFFFFPVCMLMVYSLPHTPARKARRRFSYDSLFYLIARAKEEMAISLCRYTLERVDAGRQYST
jgi:hypothetical protein